MSVTKLVHLIIHDTTIEAAEQFDDYHSLGYGLAELCSTYSVTPRACYDRCDQSDPREGLWTSHPSGNEWKGWNYYAICGTSLPGGRQGLNPPGLYFFRPVFLLL